MTFSAHGLKTMSSARFLILSDLQPSELAMRLEPFAMQDMPTLSIVFVLCSNLDALVYFTDIPAPFLLYTD